MYVNIHITLICESSKLKANHKMDKPKVVYLVNEMLLNNPEW